MAQSVRAKHNKKKNKNNKNRKQKTENRNKNINKQVLARKNQEIAKLTRAIDDIPTRAELLQYERRFVELFELVQVRLRRVGKGGWDLCSNLALM